MVQKAREVIGYLNRAPVKVFGYYHLMSQHNCILLLGAGFSRNWGGWLASEAFEYLLGCPEVDKNLLWKHKRRGGFEAALAELQDSRAGNPDPRLAPLQAAVLRMFVDMNAAYSKAQFEFEKGGEYQVAKFLTRFDAVFSLNQDLLLERHYLGDNVCLLSDGKWNGPHVAGMKPVLSAVAGHESRFLGRWEPDPANFKSMERQQPLFKLHGSSNWFSGSDGLVVMGGNKQSTIDRHPVLKWSNEQFRTSLIKPNTRLMVIGYGFGDDHINGLLREAAVTGAVKVFVIDPLGVDVMDKNKDATLYAPDELANDLWPCVIGSSRRSLREIFGGDYAEHGKLMRFFG